MSRRHSHLHRSTYRSHDGLMGWFVWYVLGMCPGPSDLDEPFTRRRWLSGVLMESYRRGNWRSAFPWRQPHD